MKLFKLRSLITYILFICIAIGGQIALAHEQPRNKLVIQVSTDDVRIQNMALNNAVNMQKLLGVDNIDIEIVAYGPGLSIMTPESPASKRIPSLALQNITFSACGNTMDTIKRKSGKDTVLVEGVRVVQAGVMRIMELQEQGYTYIRP